SVIVSGCRDLSSLRDGGPPDAPSSDGPRDAALPDRMIDARMIDAGPPTDHLLISELIVQPDSAEMIEIFNPTNAAIDLSDYYLADRNDYYRVADSTWDPTTATGAAPISWSASRPARRSAPASTLRSGS